MSRKPASPAQFAANRANAQKSTGPRTPRGKAISSRNAMQHGLLSRHFILNNDPAETESAFTSFLNAVVAQFQPHGPAESLLVERIAVSYWRLARAARFEAHSIDKARQAHFTHADTDSSSPLADAPFHILPDPADLEALVRYETLIDRELHRAMNALHALRTQHPGPAPQPDSHLCHPTAASAEVADPKKQKTHRTQNSRVFNPARADEGQKA